MSLQNFQKSLRIMSEMFDYRKKVDSAQYAKASEELEDYILAQRSATDYQENLIVLDFDCIRVLYNLDDRWDAQNITNKFKQPIIEGLENNDTLEYPRSRKDKNKKDKKEIVDMTRVICVLSHPSAMKAETRTKENSKHTKSFIDSHGLESEIFHISELQYNVTKHVLVPLHQIVKGKEEREKVKKAYNIKDFKMFPLILNTDPVVRFIGGQANDLIRIVRNPEHVGEHILYRYCVGQV